jgi:PAS domain S-box-containing protein
MMTLSERRENHVRRPTVRWSSLKTRIVGFILLSCLLLVGFDVQHVWDERSRAIEKAQHETANLARSLAQNAEDTIAAADASIVGLVQRVEFEGAAPEKLQELRKIMAMRTIAHPALADLIICDDAGHRLASALSASPMDRCVGDREYIQYHRAHRDHEMHLGPPVRGGLPGTWIIPVSRRFDHPDGSFAGVVVAAIDMAHFQDLYGTFEIGREGSILLALTDGTLLVRRPFLESKIGSSMLSGPLFRKYLPSHATGIGTAEIESAMDGVTRLMSYRRSGHYPLVVAATLAEDEVLADWRRESWKDLIGAMALAGTIAFFGLRLAAQIEKRHQVERALLAEAEQLRISEARLRKSRQHLARAQELAESGSFEFDLRTREVMWSDNLYRIFGVDRKSYAVSRVSELIHPADRERFEDSYRDHAAGIVTTAAEFRMIRPDGGCRMFIVECASSPGEHGSTGGLLGTVRDVTSAKANETALQASQEQVKQERDTAQRYLDVAGVMILVLNVEGNVTLINRRGCSILGYDDQKDIIGKSWIDLFVPKRMHGEMREAFRRLISGEDVNVEFYTNPVMTKSGEERLIAWRNSTLTDEDGSVCASLSSGEDITERKRDEDRLRRSEVHLAQAQRVASLGSFEYDVRTGELRWSDEAYRIYGVAREAFAPSIESVRSMIHPDDLAAVPSIAKIITHGCPSVSQLSCDHRIIRSDGEIRMLHRECELQYNLEGKIIGFVGTIHDVTEICAAEQQRHELQVQLLQAQKMDALGTLAGGIAHDLNNALVPAIMMTELVMETQAEDSGDRTKLALALAGARRARELVRRILTFARKETTEKHELDLATLVTEAMTMLRASLPATIELITLVQPIAAVFGDSGQLYQAIVNLVTNAAQAIGEEPGKITVTLRPAHSLSQIELTVSDTGSGMDETTKPRIFDPFFTTKAVNEGTGLGLSIVHGIVVAHGGTIGVNSQLGRGSTFCITLPAACQRPEDRTETVPAAA